MSEVKCNTALFPTTLHLALLLCSSSPAEFPEFHVLFMHTHMLGTDSTNAQDGSMTSGSSRCAASEYATCGISTGSKLCLHRPLGGWNMPHVVFSQALCCVCICPGEVAASSRTACGWTSHQAAKLAVSVVQTPARWMDGTTLLYSQCVYGRRCTNQ